MDEKVSEEERLKMNLLSERDARYQAESANVEMAQKALMSAQGQLQLEKMEMSTSLQEKYKLGKADRIDMRTGAITRAPAENAAPPPAAPATTEQPPATTPS